MAYAPNKVSYNDTIKTLTDKTNAVMDQLVTTDGNVASAITKANNAQSKADSVGTDLGTHIQDTVAHITAAERTKWNGKQDAIGYTPENPANKGVANGYASLDATGKVPAGQVPLPASSSTPTSSTLMSRDTAGRSQVADPSVDADIANKKYVDGIATTAATNLSTHTGATTGVHGAVSTATASKIIIRDANGRAQVADPAADADIATKKYADAVGVSTPTASTIMRRDANGRAQVADPSASSDIATKNYVDNGLSTKQNSLGYTAENTANKGLANGYASLDASGRMPFAQLPLTTGTQTLATDPASPFVGQEWLIV